MSVCLLSVSKCLNMSLNFFIVWCFSHIKYIVGISTVIALAGGLPCNKLAISTTVWLGLYLGNYTKYAHSYYETLIKII